MARNLAGCRIPHVGHAANKPQQFCGTTHRSFVPSAICDGYRHSQCNSENRLISSVHAPGGVLRSKFQPRVAHLTLAIDRFMYKFQCTAKCIIWTAFMVHQHIAPKSLTPRLPAPSSTTAQGYRRIVTLLIEFPALRLTLTSLIRTPTQVLQALQKSSADSLEACILECPAGLQALVEVLRDPREEVRNEVILFLGQVSVVFYVVKCGIRCSSTGVSVIQNILPIPCVTALPGVD